MERLRIIVRGGWTCNDGRGWIARRRSPAHVVVSAAVVSMASHISPCYSEPFFESPRVYRDIPCPSVAEVLAGAMGFDVDGYLQGTLDRREYQSAARKYIRENIAAIPIE